MIWILLLNSLWAQTVFVPQPGLSELALERHQVSHPNQQSFADFYLNQQKVHEQKILSLLKKAQFEFVQGSLEKAFTLYKKIAEERHNADWSAKAREVIHYSHLRLAQLTIKEEEQRRWLTQAFVFSPLQKLDESLFPPPLIERYHLIKSKQKSQVWALPEKAAAFEKILINGQQIEGHKNFIRTYPGIHRITFLSQKFQPVTLTTYSKNLESIRLQATPLLTGECHNFQFTAEDLRPQNFVVVGDTCKQPFASNSFQPTTTLGQPPAGPSLKGKTPSLFKNKWFWIGASVLVSGLTVYLIDQQNHGSPQDSPPPDSKDGGPQSFSN